MTIFVDDKLGSVSALWDQSADPKYSLLFAHGAGAGMTHKFMEDLAHAISKRHGHVLRFNFTYMEQGRKAPSSPKSAQHTIVAALNHLRMQNLGLPIFLSGKSYGGRMSSHVVAEHRAESASGLIYFGFPLHAPGRDGKDRAAHLSSIALPQLFIQGTNDKLANYEMMQEVVSDQQNGTMETIEEADHGFKVPKRTGHSYESIIDLIASKTDEWACRQI